MIQASICTIGDEILIGQVVDTNSAHIATALEEQGIKVKQMLSIGDDKNQIYNQLESQLKACDIVISTGGLGPTKDDITKSVLYELSESTAYVENAAQQEIVHRILTSRGLDILESNRRQAFVPNKAEVIPNQLGTAPILVFRFPERRFGHPAVLYSLPGVPHEAVGALPLVLEDIRRHFASATIFHRSVMVYGMAESALCELLAPWEDALPGDMHLAYLPHPLTGVKLRLSLYGGKKEDAPKRLDAQLQELHKRLGNRLYAQEESTLEETVGKLLKAAEKTLSAAESCTGGEISHLLTTVPGSSAYYLGSVTSYAVSVKEKVLGVPDEVIRQHGVVSSEVAAAMAEGVRRVTGSDYAVSTTGLAGPGGDENNPEGTVWIGVSGPLGTRTVKRQFKSDRRRNIQRFAASALDFLRLYLLEDLNAENQQIKQ